MDKQEVEKLFAEERARNKRLRFALLRKYGMLPSCTEASLFIVSLSFLLLFSTNSLMRSEVVSHAPYLLVPMALFVPAGLVLSLRSVFLRKFKTVSEKYMLVGFAAVMNILAAWFMLLYFMRQDTGFLFLLLPFWNFLSAFLLIQLFGAGIVDENAVPDARSGFFNVLAGSLVAVLIFSISQYVFDSYWAVTFSICVVYATTFNDFVSRFKN